jgi:prepilin-type N-terminal cleavage/methylation domain-containing protein
MIPMAHTKGFSLIETLVAITIASISVIALMRVISHASATSSNVVEHFNSSMMMGLVSGEVNESLDGRVISANDLLSSRYTIDHPAIRESLQSTSYEIKLLRKETTNPLKNTDVNTIGSDQSQNSMAIQKVMLQNSQDRKSFFHLTSGNL